jgi:hypothetical protein
MRIEQRTISVMLADEGKVFRKKSSGFIVGDSVSFGYDYYDAGVGLSHPYAPKPEDYDEIEMPEDYEQPPVIDQVKRLNRTSELIQQNIQEINSLGLSDNDALKVKEWYPHWEDFIGKTIEAGFVTLYADNLWRARQTHTALEIYPPSMDTAALYEVIVKEHDGTVEDPIPYNPPMEIFDGKYYMQYDVLYKCTRDSGIALTHDLAVLVGTYVEKM